MGANTEHGLDTCQRNFQREILKLRGKLYLIMSTEINHGTSKSFYGTTKPSETFDRMAWREKMIGYITSKQPKLFFKHFPNHVRFNHDDEIFEWIYSALELDDDVQLIFKYNICLNSTK